MSIRIFSSFDFPETRESQQSARKIGRNKQIRLSRPVRAPLRADATAEHTAWLVYITGVLCLRCRVLARLSYPHALGVSSLPGAREASEMEVSFVASPRHR